MIVNLIIVSKACWDILAREQIELNSADSLYTDLLDHIYDLHPQLDPDRDFKLLWQHSEQDLLHIKDFISYNTLLKSTANHTIYLLVNDEQGGNIRRFIQNLDEEELKVQKEKARSKYDVIIKPRKAAECKCSVVDLIEEEEDETEASEQEILNHALRHEPVKQVWTADQVPRHNLIDCLKKGWPKHRKNLDKVYYESEALESKLKKNIQDKR